MLIRPLLVAAVIGTGLHATRALAEPGSVTYEHRRLERVLRGCGLERDPSPAGKRIAFIRVERRDVLAEDEVWPTWPNAFHWLTDEDVVRRELLFGVGDPYQAGAVEESARNLRALSIFALVGIVAVRSAEPGAVGVLVFTRDLWSLRLELGFVGANDSGSLAGQLIERNLLGRDKALSGTFAMAPKTFELGQSYGDRRVFGHSLALAEEFTVIFNREDGEAEGTVGALTFERPFYDLGQRWAWDTSASYSVTVARALKGNELRGAKPRPNGGADPCDPGGDEDCLRRVYDSRKYALSVSGTYRRGERYKQSVSGGLAANDAENKPNAETALRPGQREAFERVLPRTRRQVYPFVRYSLYLPRYATFENLATFGQSETVRVGPAASMQFAFPLRAFGSSSDSMVVESSLAYLLAPHDALGELRLGAGARLEDGSVVDQSASARLRGATPAWLAGRFVLNASWYAQRRDTSQTLLSLGGDSGLRGYPAGELGVFGGSRVLGNLEFRTLPVDLLSVHLGLVLFYDVGSVYSSLADLDLRHAAGGGLRVLFPQVNRYVFRGDLGVPLGDRGFEIVFSFGTAQAVLLTAAEEP